MVQTRRGYRLDSVVVPETILRGTYELDTGCEFPGPDTGDFFGRWDVTVSEGKASKGTTSGKARVEVIGGRMIRLTGLNIASPNGQDLAYATLRLAAAGGSEICADNSAFCYEVAISYQAARGQSRNPVFPETSTVGIVLPDELPAGDQIMTSGPEGPDSPVVITIGEG